MKNINTKKGFTIIEVVLVLAIAGLIFLMVFVALPNLQISQRDTQRRDDVARLATSITQYQANNGGKLPISSNSTFVANYLTSGDQEFKDPLMGTTYVVKFVQYVSASNTISDYLGASPTYKSGMVVILKGKCGDDGQIEEGDGERSYAAGMKLEGTGYYCTDN